MHVSTYTPATDTLGHSAPLDQRAAFPLLGVPLEIRSNSPAVIAAAERAFGGWRGLEPAVIEPIKPCVIDIVVHEEQRTEDKEQNDYGQEPNIVEVQLPAVGSQLYSANGNGTGTSEHAATVLHRRTPNPEPRPPAPFVQRFHGDSFLASDGASMLTAQRAHGYALAFVTPQLAADEPRLRHHVLELLGLLLAAYRDRLPVHAGAIVRQGRAVLLVGRSTAGKSTLCYACLRDGFQLLAEDVVYVSMRHGLRLWGVPWQIHLLPDAVRHFAELIDRPGTHQANGKFKLAVETTAFGADRACRHVDRAVVCMIERHTGVSSALEPIDPDIPIAALTHGLESGFDLYGDPRAVAEALVAGGTYRLRVGSDLVGAVALLRELTEQEDSAENKMIGSWNVT